MKKVENIIEEANHFMKKLPLNRKRYEKQNKLTLLDAFILILFKY